jgi:hypothetical protein
MFLNLGIQAAISFSYIVSITSRIIKIIHNRALIYVFGVGSLWEMKQLASVVFQLPINLQGVLVPYLPRKGK